MSLGGTAAGLACSAAWGVGDFAGGLAAKRAPVFVVVLLSQALGFVLVGALALGVGETFPPWSELAWGGAAGLAGALGVTCLYQALASGRMGIAAPITGVVAAILPVTYAWLVEGAPGWLALLGMLIAFAGIGLASGAKAERPSPRVLTLALLSGLGFAGFLLLMGLSEQSSFLWTLTAARAASTGGLLILVLATRPGRGALGWGVVVAGLGDTFGNAFFLLATRMGRLDVAVVLSSLYPVATVLLARFVLKEKLTAAQAWGAALMLASIPLVALGA